MPHPQSPRELCALSQLLVALVLRGEPVEEAHSTVVIQSLAQQSHYHRTHHIHHSYVTSCIHVASCFQSHVQLSKHIQKAEQNIMMAQKGLSSLYSPPVLSPHASSTEHLPKGAGLHCTLHQSRFISSYLTRTSSVLSLDGHVIFSLRSDIV